MHHQKVNFIMDNLIWAIFNSGYFEGESNLLILKSLYQFIKITAVLSR